MTFENGVLTAGFHDCTYNEFYETFVEGFPTSQRRKLIVDALLDFLKEIFTVGMPYEFWIDGSFATTKINPNDADIVLFFRYDHMSTLWARFNEFRQKYDGILDIYFAYAVCPENEQNINPADYQVHVVNRRNYWRGQFGFDRQDCPKGIIRINCQSISEEIRGR